ncbi:MAG: hypothetical protein IKU08_09295 [Clostridia bacterium]|nr:hypothetical protein [Clostridia bacterium]
MLDITVELAKLFNLTPFDIFEKDKTHVLMMIDYFLSRDNGEAEKPTQASPQQIENAGGYADPIWNYI